MKLIWRDGSLETRGFGQQMKGVVKNGFRPVKVQISVDEILDSGCFVSVRHADEALGYLLDLPKSLEPYGVVEIQKETL